MEKNDLKNIKQRLDSPAMRRYEIGHRNKSCPDSFAYIIMSIIMLIIILYIILIDSFCLK